MYTIELDEACYDDASIIGGKAANLASLHRLAGIDVPPAFCLKGAAFDEATAELGIPRKMSELPLKGDLRPVAKGIQERIRTSKLSYQMARDVLVGVATHAKPYAVRSSATLEDSAKFSFAGQQDSYLGVAPMDVASRIIDCWASLYNDSALLYRRMLKIDDIGSMSVVVQDMVPAKVAGVLFTGNLCGDDPDTMVLTANWGLGSTVVAGTVTPDVYYIRKSDMKIIGRQVGKKNRIEQVHDGKFEEVDISQDARSVKECLSLDQMTQLYTIGRRIEEHFGALQDIEYCIDDSIRIVQARRLVLG